MNKIICLLALLFGLFISDAGAQKFPTEQIAAEKNGQLTLVAKETVLAACFTNFEQFANSNPHSFELWEDEAKQPYLVAKGSLDGKAMILKVNLEKRQNGLHVAASPQGESCSGVNCSNCFFLKKGGCGCSTMGSPLEPNGGFCNHIITKP